MAARRRAYLVTVAAPACTARARRRNLDEELAAFTNLSVKTIRHDIAGLRTLFGTGVRAGFVATVRMLHLGMTLRLSL
ncbi:hypothetical protein [Salinispora mooreana]|uniref:hypothetical protein n=1 Tax=Salinispora mooreana TaxID=999545 RepID=UPI0013A591B7|nr:hypothetical protein [Salinispora mooreana]